MNRERRQSWRRAARALLLLLAAAGLTGCKAFVDAMSASAEQNRTVTLTLEGAVLGPAAPDGRAWDGQPLPAGYATEFALAAGVVYPPAMTLQGSVAGTLALRFADNLMGRVNGFLAKPDSVGTVTVYEGAHELSEHRLPKRSHSYTPEWSVIVPEVKIHRARVVVSIFDSDFWSDQPMGKVIISESEMLAAEESGDLYVLDTSEETAGAVLRLLITVSS